MNYQALTTRPRDRRIPRRRFHTTSARRRKLPDMPIPPYVEAILDAAQIAPSYNNMQPWRFAVEGDTISFLVDHERDRSPANANGRMARIGVGAAVECAVLRAGRMGSTVRFETPRENALVTFTVSPAKRTPEPDKALVRRTTNRRLYDGRPLDDATFTWLQEATPSHDATRTLWFGRERVRALGLLIEEGETLFFGDIHRLREGALKAIRFDARDREEVARAIAWLPRALSSSERMALDALRRTPQDRLVAMGAFAKMGARARRLVESASGLCVITTQGWDPSADVAVGRIALRRAWLALTRRGLVAQPITSIAALGAILEGSPDGAVQLNERERASSLVASVRAAFPSADRGSRIALLMRFGWAPPATARVRRMSLADSVVEAVASSGIPPA